MFFEGYGLQLGQHGASIVCEKLLYCGKTHVLYQGTTLVGP
jgi:hypothetical protein